MAGIRKKHILVTAIAVISIIGAMKMVPEIRPFKRHELKIEDMPSIITEVRSMSTLVTACYCDEVILTSKKRRDVNAFGTALGHSYDEICIIAKGKVRAGMDLSEMDTDSFTIDGDTLMVTLPAVKIIDVIVNPADYEIFSEEGKWSHEEVMKVESRAKSQMTQDALNSGVMKKATESAERQIRSLLKAFGFKEVIFVPASLKIDNNGF